MLVYARGQFQTVYIRNRQLQCDCEGHQRNCHFVAIVQGKLTSDDELLASFKDRLVGDCVEETVYEQRSISSKPLVFCG